MPTGWYLECTTAGTTSSDDLTISSPAIGDRVDDGTMKWAVVAPLEMYGKYVESDYNDFTKAGMYIFNTVAHSTVPNKPPYTGVGGLIVFHSVYDTTPECITQLAISSTNNLYTRTKHSDTWKPWQQQEAIVARSLSSSGYIKYASGLIIQWGAILLDTNETYKTKALPVLFSAVFAICGNVNYANGGASAVRAVNINILYTNTIVAQIESAINGVVGIVYIAIGY